MDSNQTSEIRNYLTAAGFLLIGLLFVITAIASVIAGGDVAVRREMSYMTTGVLGIVLFIAGILLAIVRGRDLAAITFMLTGFLQATYLLGNTTGGATNLFCIVNILWAVILLFAEDRQKFLFFAVNLLMGLIAVFPAVPAIPAAVRILLFILIILITFYCAFAAGFERITLPGRNLICADTETDFKKSGSALGYIIFAMGSGCWALMYLAGEVSGTLTGVASMQSMELVFGISMLVVAVLLFAVGKMRFTPVMFLLVAAGFLLASYATGMMIYAVGILFVIAGLFAIMRKESRILAGLMLILYGCTAFLSAIGGGAGLSVVSLILNAVPCLIALYLAVAALSQRKMPLF